MRFALATCNLTTCTFDLWMSKEAHDVFDNTFNKPCQGILYVKYFGIYCEPRFGVLIVNFKMKMNKLDLKLTCNNDIKLWYKQNNRRW